MLGKKGVWLFFTLCVNGAHVLDGHFDLLKDGEIQRGYDWTKLIETEYLSQFQKNGCMDK